MSARVTAPAAGFSGTVAGVVFTDGVATTDDRRAMSYLRRHGYRVERDEVRPGPDETGLPEGDPDESWTKAQLFAWAATHGVETTVSARKDDLLAAIAEHLTAVQAPGELVE